MFEYIEMKKITPFIMLVLMLAYTANTAHAFADSFHSLTAGNHVSIEALSLDNDIPIAPEHDDCSSSCHVHLHLYSNAQSIHHNYMIVTRFASSGARLFTDLSHKPDSPPPDFS